MQTHKGGSSSTDTSSPNRECMHILKGIVAQLALCLAGHLVGAASEATGASCQRHRSPHVHVSSRDAIMQLLVTFALVAATAHNRSRSALGLNVTRLHIQRHPRPQQSHNGACEHTITI
jgi:hypothetical protein